MNSIVYAGRNLLPAKRENSSGLRGCLTCRITMSTRMPTTVAMPSSSSIRWYTFHEPMTGQWKCGLNVCGSASNQRTMPARKPTITSQWAMPTVRFLIILVWARNSTTTSAARGMNGRQRSGAGCPCAMIRTIRRAPLKKVAQAITKAIAPIVPRVIVTAVMSWSTVVHLSVPQALVSAARPSPASVPHGRTRY